MHSQFNQKLALKALKSMTLKLTYIVLLLLPTAMLYAQNETPKAKWYRYYDNKGIANISTSVTPNHIRHGYEALDQNMQVIKRAKPYNAEADIKQAPQRAAQAKQQADDIRLKKAYTSSTTAKQKQIAMLSSIKKQIAFQQDQLKQLQTDRIMFKRQEMEFLRKGQTVPKTVKDTLIYNEKNMIQKKQSIHSLQTYYRKTQTEYDQIIARLKLLESQ